MSKNKILAVLLIAWQCFASSSMAATGAICPTQRETALRYVDIFDGTPEQQAKLIPDHAGVPNRTGASSGYWELGYVYDAERFITVRCKYGDGASQDVRISTRVNRCLYTIDSRKNLDVRCK